ncbi:MAG TPA: hypothetical protein VLF90_00200, partial [Patescibacteria group bacterium]|nr:hypothetical protein [Patescibacteria group bacterium]
GYNTADGAFQACVPPMGQLGYYKQFPGDASKYGTFKILASEMVESQSAPMWDGTCFFGDVYHELHIHRNHVVGWEGDIASRGTGVQICKPPLWTYVP